jgi:hypothetical protein
MATYPESSPTPTYPLILSPRTQTVITALGGASEHRTAKLTYPQIDVLVTYAYMTAAHMETLWEFYEARLGAYEGFYIYDLRLLQAVYPSWVSRFVCTADGTNLTYDLPGRSTSGHTIYADGVALTVTTDYSIVTGGGSSSSDRITLTGAAGDWTGKVITANFTGILRIPVRFAEDSTSFEMFEMSYFRHGGIKLHGLKWG